MTSAGVPHALRGARRHAPRGYLPARASVNSVTPSRSRAPRKLDLECRVVLLDPKLDVVFKLLLTREESLLRSMLEVVLRLTSPIAELTVLNPDVERELAADKGAVLDIRVALADGTVVDIEMQLDNGPVQRQRILYYWARLYAGELLRGEEHSRLRPVIVIVWMIRPLLETQRFHAKFEVIEGHGGERLSNDLVIHILELSKLGLLAQDEPDRLLRWARFFTFKDEAELDALAKEDPIMEKA